ncbi:hypothetical protein, partial [Streptomyces africanus]|uniref:hypothetical protein n=1 Tax=Streptomyces africanus TaxID=231024 RepID=UPI001AC00B66
RSTDATPANPQTATKGFLASMVAPVEPARATFNLAPTANSDTHQDAGDGVLDRSAPGKSSASFHDTDQAATNDPTGQKRKAQGSVWKAWLLAGAQRWAKGGGTANKRLDVKKAQAQANQVKEARTTTVSKSGGLLPVRNSGGSGAGPKGNAGKSGGTSGAKGPVNSSGNRSGGAGRGGSGGGGRGPGGSSGSSNAGGGGRHRDAAGHGKGTGAKGPGPGGSGKGSAGPNGSARSGASGKSTNSGGKGHGVHDSKTPKPTKDSSGKGPGKSPGSGSGSGSGGGSGAGSGGAGKPGAAGKAGAAGKDGKHDGKPGAGASGGPGSPAATGPDGGKPNKKPGKNDTAHNNKHGKTQHDTRTPLEKSRETGHKDGRAVRGVVDHVKAYKDGAVDGYRDKRDENAREHARLNKAHADHKTKPAEKNPAATKAGRPQPVIVTEQEDDGVTTDVKPLTVKSIDANTLTLGADATRATYGRRELRNFKQYERKLEAKETDLQKIAEACKQLEKEAEKEAKDCQDLLEQAKGVKGGEKVVGKLTKLADAAKNQTAEAAELAKRAKRAAEMCKVVLTNIQTRYAPLYKAVVDSDETKPAELRFYNDKGSYAPAA